MALKSTWRKVDELEANKQDELVSGVNIKTINSTSLLGSGNITISGGGGISDGDKGDITVSGSGSVWTIDNNAVTNAKINDVDATKVTEDSTHRFVTDAEKTSYSLKQDALVSGSNLKTIEGQSLLGSGNIDLTKSDVGLGNVDNTSDLNKPVSTAQATAIGLKQDTLISGTNIKTINGSSVLGSGNLSISSTPTTGTAILITADETDVSGSTNSTVKTYVLASNTYSRIIIESECEFQSGANVLSTCDFAIYVNSTQKRVVENLNSATGAGDFVRSGISIKYSEAITAGATITIRTQNVVSANWNVCSLRVYGII